MTDLSIDDESAAFWIGGLAVAVGAAIFLAYPEGGKPFENAEYLALGAAVPALACALVLGKTAAKTSARVRAGLAALFAAFVALYLIKILGRLEWQAWIAAGIVAAWLRRAGARWKTVAAAFVASAVGFVCAFRLIWWHGGWPALWAREPFVPFLLAGFTILGLAAFLPAKNATPRLKLGVWDAAALLLFALGSTRITVDVHDGAFFTGTIALLRQGAWLLWDAPSQYGFLNMALASLVPAKSAWQAVYLANCPLLFASAAAVYAGLRLTTRGRSGVLFSALLAWAAVLVATGRVEILDGPNANPSVGAFRFLWCYALLLWAAALFLRRKAGKRLELRELAPGVVFWTLGCLWSFESAAYSTAAAWPVFVLAAVELAKARRRRDAALAVLAPAAALEASIAAIDVYYLLRLGHGPDWRGFVEYPLVYMGGFGVLSMHALAGAVAVLIWVGVLIVALAAVSFKKSPAARWLIIPAFALFWMTASYFVSRSHDNNVLNLMPVWLSALIAAFFAADEALPAVRVLRAGALPLMAGILLAPFANPANLRRHVASLLASRNPDGVDRLLPLDGGEIEWLLNRAGVRPDEPIAFFWPYLLERPIGPENMPALPRFWLPVAPALEFSLLDLPRQRLYVRRFPDREGPAAASGWTLEPKEFDRPDLSSQPIVAIGPGPLLNPRASGLYAELLADHLVDAVVESPHWRLRHWMLSPAPPAAAP